MFPVTNEQEAAAEQFNSTANKLDSWILLIKVFSCFPELPYSILFWKLNETVRLLWKQVELCRLSPGLCIMAPAVLTDELAAVSKGERRCIINWQPAHCPKSTVCVCVCDVRGLTVCLCCRQVECVVETRDKTQSAQLRKTLSERYPSLCWLDRWSRPTPTQTVTAKWRKRRGDDTFMKCRTHPVTYTTMI